ncbi:MAG: tetratricopeptide repeat protein [Verrucomicrobiota bacterium]
MQPALDTELWVPLAETIGAYEQFHDWDLKWLRRFGRDIIDSIPTNSIYFGGTSAGQYIIATLSDSHREGRPFFTLTQNQLRDESYLTYLRIMYGSKLYIPTSADVNNAFHEHLDFVSMRLKNEGPKPSELMPIEARLVKVIMERNPGREFYLQESYPMEWIYPHLSPHGLIFKLHGEPLAELSEAIVTTDRNYWAHYVKELLGDWLTPETSVKEICDFSDRVFRRNDLSGLRGDREFTQNKAAQKEFSKLRAAIGKLYAWRAEHASSPKEKERMLNEADLAFRQALALCPYSPEAVFPYAQLLVNQQRRTEVRLIAETWHQIDPGDQQVQGLLENLKMYDKAR